MTVYLVPIIVVCFTTCYIRQVVRFIRNASQWLLKHTLSGHYKPYNVIFSGSVKTEDVSVAKINYEVI